MTVNDGITLNEDLSSFSWPGVQTPADAANRAAWQEAGMRVRVAELALSESRRGGLPRLGLNGRYAYNMQTHLEDGKSSVEFDVASVNLRLDVPLFQGNYYRAMQTKNKLQLEAARYDEERTRATLTQQQNDWAAQYAAAHRRNEVLKEKLANATENLRIAKLSMNEGAMEFDEFNNIFAEYNRARIEYIQNLADGILYHLLSTQKF
jgi:outer membrane protein TolC